MKKTIVLANFPRFSNQIWLPTLWTSAKTYYERNGKNVDDWNWFPCYLDLYSEEYFDQITKILYEIQPQIFAISLYVWNYKLSHRVAQWVKKNISGCLVISGGPHQYFKHDSNWFQKNWYIDASLPGDSYGEIALKEILDNYENGKVEWDQVTDIRYPSGKKRFTVASTKVMPTKAKKSYDYDYAPYAEQQDFLKDFVDRQQQVFPKAVLGCVIETTRGCPYACTYCDWGGGTNTVVIKKSLENVKKDIDVLRYFALDFLYLGDANFGIFEQRDIDIIKYLAYRPFWSKQRFKIGYGGFAKTENRLETIKRIVEIDVKSNLSQQKEIKISLQTLDSEVLKNIDRKNISLDKQLEALEPIAKDNKLPIYAEIILGLPGMTLEKFYTELDILGANKLSLQFFEWILLPETPAYSREYREKFGLIAVDKLNGWTSFEAHSHASIVVGAKSFSTDDYLQMLLSASLYRLIIQGGFYKNTINCILQQNVKLSELIKLIVVTFFPNTMFRFHKELQDKWHKILTDKELTCEINVGECETYIGWYFVAMAYYEPLEFTTKLIEFLKKEFSIPDYVIDKDREVEINVYNWGTKKFRLPWVINYKKGKPKTFDFFLGVFQQFEDSGKILQAKKTFLI